MASTLQASTTICQASSSSPLYRNNRNTVKAAFQTSNIRISLPKLPSRNLVLEESNLRNRFSTLTSTTSTSPRDADGLSENKVIAELYAVLEAVSDRIEMHANVAEQRNNWNNLLLNSVNTMTIGAATMVALASTNGELGESLKVAPALLYTAVTGILLVMNKIQPSQLAEEQRNATRLFKQLHSQIQTTLAIGSPTHRDVNDAMEKVLAIDKAYPLPLLGGVMLEKFPKKVEPAVWWPKQRRLQSKCGRSSGKNGWSDKLEEEMTNIIAVLKNKDMVEYHNLGKKAVKINKALSITGPLLTGIAAIGSAFVGAHPHGSEAVMVGVVAGALATVVNTMEHGGQVGMVVEMYRSCAGSFLRLQESIEATLNEKEFGRRENGEIFERKVAIQLGRSLSELRILADSSSLNNSEEFASKLF